MTFCFKNTNKDIIMTEEDEEDFKNNKICRFCEKKILNLRRIEIIVTSQVDIEVQPIVFVILTLLKIKAFLYHLNFTTFLITIVIRFFRKLVDKKKDKVNFDFLLKTNDEYISLASGCIRFTDGYGVLSSSLDSLVKNLDNDHLIILKEEFPDKWQYLNKKLAYPFEYFHSIE